MDKYSALLGTLVILTIVSVVGAVFYLGPTYNVWAQEQGGKADLAHATYAKQVAVQEAIARNESAYYDAQADITRASGQATANKILGNSLSGTEGQAYLRYLYIQALTGKNNQIIYVPTEAGLPILEANRLNQVSTGN